MTSENRGGRGEKKREIWPPFGPRGRREGPRVEGSRWREMIEQKAFEESRAVLFNMGQCVCQISIGSCGTRMIRKDRTCMTTELELVKQRGPAL